MSDLENELLGLAEDGPRSGKKRRSESRSQAKSKEYIDDSDDGDEMDMDLESEEGDSPPAKPSSSKAKIRSAPKGSTNPYPLEGKYLDEDDRDQLDAMPEIEREAILAGRLEEMQKVKDSQQLDALYRMTRQDKDEDEDDEEHARKKRKHTSVSKEAYKAMRELKNKRKSQDERAARMAIRRERRHRSGSPSTSASDEEGEISHSQRDRAYSPDYSPPISRKKEPSPGKRTSEKDLDAIPMDIRELNAARISRYEIVDMMYKDGFEGVLVGAYVRVMSEDKDQYGQPKYRIQRVESLEKGVGRYNIEYKGRSYPESRGLLCSYGKGKRLFRMADVSNGDIEQSEFSRFTLTYEADKVRLPKRSELQRKHEAIKALRERPMSDAEVNRKIQANQDANPNKNSKKLIAIAQLVASRNLAARRNDDAAVEHLNREIVAIGGDPVTGDIAVGAKDDADKDVSEYDRRIEQINEAKQRKMREQMEKAHAGSLARKKAEEAIIKARQAALKTDSPGPGEIKPAVTMPATGLRKGETPQQFVARTIDLDLGDF